LIYSPNWLRMSASILHWLAARLVQLVKASTLSVESEKLSKICNQKEQR
jgi:hypothetical protein